VKVSVRPPQQFASRNAVDVPIGPSLPFVVIPNERSEEGSLFLRPLEQHHSDPPRLLEGRSFRVCVAKPGFRQGTDLSAPQMLENQGGFSR
jgi:hypothetical protein